MWGISLLYVNTFVFANFLLLRFYYAQKMIEQAKILGGQPSGPHFRPLKSFKSVWSFYLIFESNFVSFQQFRPNSNCSFA